MIVDMSFVPDVLRQAEGLSHEKGWDTPARLYSLHAEDLGGGIAIGVADVPGFDLAMSLSGHCYYALRAMTKTFTMAPPASRPDMSGMVALILVDEAWMVKVEPGQAPPEGSFKDHPGAVEYRFALLLAGDGSTASLIRERGGEPQLTEHGWRDGRIVTALGDLFTAAWPEDRS